jgi:eukaryotic-like serine/threonine-protein kinase
MPNPPDIASSLSDRYAIEREIGAGGMAVVYLARDKKLDREVALKVLRPELGAVLGSARFLAEIKISARLDHPHILTLIDSGDADGLLYYVLPYVRGESLRVKLTRERQLGLDEALTITRQVASALDYAHRQGLVHRDIKPENILLQEGEAMLTDFGIALAVKEAGAGRLTETGLSLGTPQYMSPEQATGDRGIDARSDVYSLASVLYEMLAGEPPVTGANAQSMIAKLMTERPTRLRVLRDTVPVGVDAAVAKALAKTPADRFASAGEFARALETKPATDGPADGVPSARRRTVMVAGVIAIAALVAGGAYAYRGRLAPHVGGGAVLGQKTQLTLSGAVLVPAISRDGKQLAYLTKHCASGACTFSVEEQDVGGTTTRTILENATSGYGLEWSPDRRNLAFTGSIDGRAGTYLLSALGGTPRFLTGGVATFYAGGDSLLLGPTTRPDSVYWIGVAALDGTVRDSIRVAGSGQGLAAISVVPGTSWIVTLVLQQPHGLWQVIDRTGKVADHVVNACTCGGIATSDAVWLARAGHGDGESIVRIAIDRTNGRLATRQDTMVTGLFTNFSLTADGAGMVRDEGTYDFSVWALDMADVLSGRYADDHRVAHASSPVSATVSPDGGRLLVRRTVPTGGGHAEDRYTVMPFAGGSERPLSGAGVPVQAFWADSVTAGVATQTPTGLHLAQIDVRTGAQRNGMDLPDSVVTYAGALPDGWVWIPAAGDRIVVRQAGRTRDFPKPAWYAFLYQVVVDPSRHRVFYAGANQSTGDSLGVGVLSLSDGSMTQWASMFAEYGRVTPLTDGTALLEIAQTQESLTFFKLAGPAQNQRLGVSPRPVRAVAVSSDLKRAAALERDYRADAWMSQVVRQ